MKSTSILSLFTIFILYSCQESETKATPTSKEVLVTSLETVNEKFDKCLIASLHNQLKSDFELEIKLSHFEDLLNGVDISALKNGEEYQKSLLFEDFECDCTDKLKISYDIAGGRFIFLVYEEIYVADLDWCPESSYTYSFIIKQNEISDLKLDFMAG